MIVCGLDIETTGLSPIDDDIIEFGAVFYDVEKKSPVSMINEFIYTETPISSEAAQVHGIFHSDLEKYGKSLSAILQFFYYEWVRFGRPICVAHNGTAFDRKFLEPAIGNASGKSFEAGWIDTIIDVPYPKHITTRKLSFLAAEHGFLNPFPHRALFDVLTMLKVLSFYDIEEVIKTSQLPMIKLVAQVSFEEKHKAKEKGFYWNPDNKYWFKILRENQVEQLNLDFKCYIEEVI